MCMEESVYGVRNAEGEMFLEIAVTIELAVTNTWFVKNDSKKVTYELGGTRTVVDYVLVRPKELCVDKD